MLFLTTPLPLPLSGGFFGSSFLRLAVVLLTYEATNERRLLQSFYQTSLYLSSSSSEDELDRTVGIVLTLSIQESSIKHSGVLYTH